MNIRNILRACVFVVLTPESYGIYINGKLYDSKVSFAPLLDSIGRVMEGKLSIIDSWVVLEMEHKTALPQDQNVFSALYPSLNIPTYEGPSSHPGLVTGPPRDPERPHVRWFVWFNSMNQVVYIGDRRQIQHNLEKRKNRENSGTLPDGKYRSCWEYTRDIATQFGGSVCTEFSVEKFDTMQAIKDKYKLAQDYREDFNLF